MSGSRAYHSPLREQQTERTRALILEALVDLLNDDGLDGLNIKDLASRAGVSERTVYRHFPDRTELREALSEHVFARASWTDMTELMTPHELATAAAGGHRDFDEHERDTRALVLMNVDPARVVSESRRHQDHVTSLVTTTYPHLDDEEVAGVAALLHLMGSSRTWLRFRDAHGLSGAQTGRFVWWVLQLVLGELDAGKPIPRPPEPDDTEPDGS